MISERFKKGVIRAAQSTWEISDRTEASGTRYRLPLEGREIEMVYYRAERPGAPLIVGMHGGGFLFGGCAMDDAMWLDLSRTLGVNVASIGYRRTPDHMYPEALEDVYDAILYMRNEMPELDFDRNHMSVFGNSAGANLAATVALKLKANGLNILKYQILNYPFLDVYTDCVEKGEKEEDSAMYRLFNELYVNQEDARDIYVSPYFASVEELKGLPETIMTISECDILRPEDQEYAMKLQMAGVTVHTHLAKDMLHAFYEDNYGKPTPFEVDPKKSLRESGRMAEETRKTLAFIKENYMLQ